MPFSQVHTEIPGLSMGLWRIQEDETFFVSRLNIYENEARILKSISHPQKRLEWLSSRLCLKELLNIHHRVESLNREDGKPYLTDNSFHISYTHSNHISGAIAASNAWVSMDLEDLTKTRNPEARKLFCHKTELDLYDEINDIRLFYLLWSAKETLYKIHPRKGLVFKENLILDFVDRKLKPEGLIKGIIQIDGEAKEYEIQYKFFPDVVLTYTFDPIRLRQTARRL